MDTDYSGTGDNDTGQDNDDKESADHKRNEQKKFVFDNGRNSELESYSHPCILEDTVLFQKMAIHNMISTHYLGQK